MATRLEPLAGENWLARSGRGNPDIRILDRLTRAGYRQHLDLQLLCHTPAEVLAGGLAPAVDRNGANRTHRADALQLRFRLLTRANQPDVDRLGNRQVPRGQTAHRACTQLSQPFSLNQRK